MKTKLYTIVVAAVLIVATLFVSCAPANKAVADETVTVFFGELQAKGINEEAYSVSSSGDITSKVDQKTVDSLYWSYRATK